MTLPKLRFQPRMHRCLFAAALCMSFVVVGPGGLVKAAQEGPPGNSADDALVQAGVSGLRLERLRSALTEQVQAGYLQGAVLMLARRGHTVLTEAVGSMDADGHKPMSTDAVFDLGQLTEPVTAAAAVALQEQGKWLLSDEIGRYLPAFEPLPVSLLSALNHTAGLAASVRPPRFGPNQPDTTQTRLNHSADAALHFTGQGFVERLASLPLVHAPGLVAQRSFSYDILGLALEKASAQTLGTFFLRNLFIPLDMWDTGFNPPASLETRLVLARSGGSGRTDQVSVRDLRDPVSFECGGACLTSTAADYLRFANMLLDGGKAGKARVLSRPGVAMMTHNQLASSIENRLPSLAGVGRTSGRGLGLETAHGSLSGLPVQAGDFGLVSTAGSFFWVSPSEELVVVMLAVPREPDQVARLQRQVLALAFQSIND